MAAHALMVAGTASHAGKSWMATAICRWLRRRGVRVAPFKAQNMSLNSYPAANGGEIGRAQVAQAEACGLAPTTDMNPILLKPTSPSGCQVVLHGRVWKNVAARDYGEHVGSLWGEVESAFCRLAGEFELIVMEGAGGAAEINLRSRDLVNLPLAQRVGAPVLLVADIDRGGVFASVVGTLSLLPREERALVRAVAVNRFRGDPALFDEGRRMLERHAGVPCLGVFPFVDDIHLDAEDSVSLPEAARRGEGSGALDTVIVRLPHISNFTDFSLLRGAQWLTSPGADPPDCIVIPGSKNTISDLRWLWRRGLGQWILDCHRHGAIVWGICGGFQMLGEAVSDPGGVEGGGEAPGLGLLPVRTELRAPKVTRTVQAELASTGRAFSAYEIHMGQTIPAAGRAPFAYVGGRSEGFRRGGVVGTYLHGALEDPDVLHELQCEAARRRGKPQPPRPEPTEKEKHYDRLAGWFGEHADIELFERCFLGGLRPC